MNFPLSKLLARFKRHADVRWYPAGYGQRIGTVSWRVTAEISGKHLTFTRKKDAQLYKELLLKSHEQIQSIITRREVDDETGLHITHPKEK